MADITPDSPLVEATPEAEEYPSPTIVDSRRLMGPNLYSALEGVLLEVRLPDDEVLRTLLCEEWELAADVLSSGLFWPDIECQAHVHGSDGAWGAMLFFEAPVDLLLIAAELNEFAWVCAERALTDPHASRFDEAATSRIRQVAAAVRAMHPSFDAVHRAALARDVTVAFDDESLSLGSGEGALVWPLAKLPDATAIEWDTIRDVPVSLVTGSNGKTTTTRLVAAMWRQAGKVAGFCCSDGVWVDEEQLDSGDFSGPAGARTVLRDTRVQAAVLETARGGILRRGLAVHRASSAIITNIAADHFGEYGVHTLHDLAATKFVVARAVGDAGRLVLNADDATIVAHAPTLRIGQPPVPLAWFSMEPTHPALDDHVLGGGDAATLHDGHVMLHHDMVWHDLGEAAAMPLTLGGTAPHNIANILGASLLGAVTGIPIEAIRETLRTFGASSTDNAGRLQLYQFGEMRALVDYAHNPDGLAALCKTANALPATRRLLVLGQAGNRDDSQLRALVNAAWSVTHFDRVIIKEMERMLRGRALGELPAVFTDELRRLGVPSDQVEVAPSEFEAMRRAFAWAREGDVLVCPVHTDKQLVLEWLARVRDARWLPGMTLPM